MPFCRNCGNNIDEDAVFCPKCGAATGETQKSASDIEKKIKDINNTEDNTSEFDAEDIKKSKTYAILAYIPLLNLITLFCSKNSKYAKYHLNQGFILIALEAAWSIIASILSGIVTLMSFIVFWLYVVFNVIFIIISILVGIALLALIIMGIVNAATGKAKKLPIVGKFN